MQPKDFDDEVASSADRGQKRRRRRAHADKWKVLETPGAGLLLQGAAHAYVEETQPRSPVSIGTVWSATNTGQSFYFCSDR